MKKIFIAFFLLNICSSFGCKNPEPEDYLIPKGYIGRVTVIFNQKKGALPKRENGRRVYEIPTSGIFLTQFKAEYGFINHCFYYVDENGKRTPLEIFRDEAFKDRTSKADKNKVGIFEDGITGQYAEDDKAPYQFFFVTSYNGQDTLETFDHFNNRVNQLIGTNL
jgi:hypothetical protein